MFMLFYPWLQRRLWIWRCVITISFWWHITCLSFNPFLALLDLCGCGACGADRWWLSVMEWPKIKFACRFVTPPRASIQMKHVLRQEEFRILEFDISVFGGQRSTVGTWFVLAAKKYARVWEHWKLLFVCIQRTRTEANSGFFTDMPCACSRRELAVCYY